MNAKKVKRMCSVKGCHNTDTYAITRTKEYGGVIICEKCLKDAALAIENGGTAAEVKESKADVPLFHHPEQNEKAQEGKIICPVCGKECKNQLGLNSHMKTHGEKEDDDK